MNTIIQKVSNRSVAHLLQAIPEASIVEDAGSDPIFTFVRCLIKSENQPFLYLQDDVDLCADFRERVTLAVELYPNELISFFTLKERTKTAFEAGANYCMSQCVYFPAGMANRLHDSYLNGWKRARDHPTSFDFLIADYLQSMKLKYVLWHPSLVQHQPVKSAINPSRSTKRQSKNFADDLCQ